MKRAELLQRLDELQRQPAERGWWAPLVDDIVRHGLESRVDVSEWTGNHSGYACALAVAAARPVDDAISEEDIRAYIFIAFGHPPLTIRQMQLLYASPLRDNIHLYNLLKPTRRSSPEFYATECLLLARSDRDAAWWCVLMNGADMVDITSAFLLAYITRTDYRWLYERIIREPRPDIRDYLTCAVAKAAIEMPRRAPGERTLLRLLNGIIPEELTVAVFPYMYVMNNCYALRILFEKMHGSDFEIYFGRDPRSSLSPAARVEIMYEPGVSAVNTFGFVSLHAGVLAVLRDPRHRPVARRLITLLLAQPTISLRAIGAVLGDTAPVEGMTIAVDRWQQMSSMADGTFHRLPVLPGWRPDRHRWASAPCREQLATVLALARPMPTTALRLAAAFFDAHMVCALPRE